MDARHVNIHELPGSCGVASLSGFNSSVDQILFAFASYLYHPSRGQPVAFAVWSDIEDSLGQQLFSRLALIGAAVTMSPPRENPKTGNIIQVYVWCIDHEQFKKWYKEERIERIKKQ